MNEKILRLILLPLADQFEAGRNDHCVTLKVTTPEEFEPFRETMAALRADGPVKLFAGDAYKFTASGYAKYGQIQALRVLA